VLCKSIFYCFFDSFVESTPFLCVNFNCRSKTFFSHESKSLTILWKKLKIREKLVNRLNFLQKNIDIELCESKNLFLLPGNKIGVFGVLKIEKDKKIVHKISFFRNFFGLYIRAQKILFPRMGKFFFQQKNFLTKTEYNFLKKLNSSSDIFNICLKSMGHLIYGNQGFKAAVLLSLCHDNLKKKNQKISLGFCFCENHYNKKKILRDIAAFSPKGFLIYKKLKSFKAQTYSSFINKKKFFEVGFLNFSKRNGLVCFEKRILEKENFRPKNATLIKKKNNLELFNKDFRNLVYDCPENKGKKFDFDKKPKESFFLTNQLFPTFDLFFIISNSFHSHKDIIFSEHTINLTKMKKICPYSRPINRNEKKKASVIRKFFLIENNKKRLSPFILRRFLGYIKICIVPIFSEKASNMIADYYVNFRFFQKKNNIELSRNILETLLFLSQSRTKIDLRKIVSENDVLDVTEIFSDSKIKYRKNWDDFMSQKHSNTGQQTFLVYNFLKSLKKIHAQKNQVFFDLEDLKRILKQKLPEKKIKDIIEILFEYGSIEKIHRNIIRIK